jgi:hypothetical protein
MPAASKSHQRLMGMVYAYKKGDLDLKDLSPSLAKKIKDIADGKKRKTGDRRKKTKGISLKNAKEFASTKHEGLPEKVEEGSEYFDKDSVIDFIMDSTMFERDFLEEKSEEELMELYYEVCDFLEAHPIDPRAHLEEYPEEDEENEGFITKFDSFINEAKKNKKPKGQKASFVDWWNKSFEKKADYWVEKKEINQGYQPNELTHYYERKMKSKYNKYLKKKRK